MLLTTPSVTTNSLSANVELESLLASTTKLPISLEKLRLFNGTSDVILMVPSVGKVEKSAEFSVIVAVLEPPAIAYSLLKSTDVT